MGYPLICIQVMQNLPDILEKMEIATYIFFNINCREMTQVHFIPQNYGICLGRCIEAGDPLQKKTMKYPKKCWMPGVGSSKQDSLAEQKKSGVRIGKKIHMYM